MDVNGKNLSAESVIGDYNWQNYQIDFDIKLMDGVDRYVFFRRADNENYYCLDFMGQWSWLPKLSLNKASTQDGDTVFEEVLVSPNVFNFGEEYHVKIKVQEENIKIYLNSETEPIIEVEDSETRLTRGNIALGGWTGDYGKTIVHWDNVQIKPL